MLELFARHGRFDLKVRCRGDTWVDDHHSVEDIGIALGQAFDRALGDKKGIRRYGQRLLPMDETLILCAVDLSGRKLPGLPAADSRGKGGRLRHGAGGGILPGLCAQRPLHAAYAAAGGKNSHHILEGTFKSVARALREAAAIDPEGAEEIPSTKGIL